MIKKVYENIPNITIYFFSDIHRYFHRHAVGSKFWATQRRCILPIHRPISISIPEFPLLISIASSRCLPLVDSCHPTPYIIDTIWRDLKPNNMSSISFRIFVIPDSKTQMIIDKIFLFFAPLIISFKPNTNNMFISR